MVGTTFQNHGISLRSNNCESSAIDSQRATLKCRVRSPIGRNNASGIHAKEDLNWRAGYSSEHVENKNDNDWNARALSDCSTADLNSAFCNTVRVNGRTSSGADDNFFVAQEDVSLHANGFDYLHHKRPPHQRVFVNRNLRMEKIQFFGFDMDYTLAEYKTPQMEKMTFELVVNRLISIGYPEEFRSFEYNPVFPVRGLWFDSEYGNLLKVDGFGSILIAVHGFKFLKPIEIEELYPNKFLHLSDRVYVLNTLFNLPETYLVACVVNYFDKHISYQLTSDKTGLKNGDVVMSYKSLYQDIRSAVNWVHFGTIMKSKILKNVAEYVEKDERVKQLLTLLRSSGRKIFLLTNSDYSYTNGIMNYLLGSEWMSFFDTTVVDARKPLWFGEGTVFREVDTKSGALKIGIHAGPLRSGTVYSGGSCDSFCRLVKARGKDVLYIGDHIFGDVLRSKKTRGWRTFLVVPELEHELRVWTGKQPLFEKLRELDSLMADIYKNLDVSTRKKPKIENIIGSIRTVTHEMDQEYGVLGSLFRSGSRTTFFATQVERYADLYASSCYNLVHYPMFYFFRAPMTLMPHESTVDHTAQMREPRESSFGQVRAWNKSAKSSSYSFEEEDDDDDEAEDSSNTTSTSTVAGVKKRASHAGRQGSKRTDHSEHMEKSDASSSASPLARKDSSDTSMASERLSRHRHDENKCAALGKAANDSSNNIGKGSGGAIAADTHSTATTDVVVAKSSYVDEEC